MKILLSNLTAELLLGTTLKIFVDYDCVLSNLQAESIKKAKKEYGVELTFEDINSWSFFDKYPLVYSVFKEWELYKEAEDFDQSIWFMEQLYAMFGKENVYILTHTHESFINEKDEEIKKTYGTNNIIHAEHKYLHTGNHVLIDDYHINVELHAKHNKGLGLLFDRKGEYGWSKEPIEDKYENVMRVTSYEEILSVLAHVAPKR